ncbi:MAG TPA: nucleotide sugar dehydrogenase [Geminicoccaceae bacterium]
MNDRSSERPGRPGADEAGAGLEQRLRDRTARVAVIGLGYVGLPLLRAVVGAGFDALGLDIDPAKVAALNAGRSYIRHLGDAAVGALVASGRFQASTDFDVLATADVVVVCVPTPLTRQREPDLGFVVRTAEAIAQRLQPGQLVVLESTTYPGTTLEVLKPILERSGLRVGSDVFLAYAPEREDPGNSDYAASRIPKVVGGADARATALATAFYAPMVERVVPVSSAATAEAVKLTENVFRAVNIALVNELKVIFEAMAIDVWEVIDAAATKPFGYMPFYPGPGLGGHCVPIDPFYLTWKAREFDIATRFIELAGEINTEMPRHVVGRLALALDLRFGRGLSGARILVLGVAYKKNVDDMRESPALRIIDLLEARRARVAYHDPHIPELPPSRHYPELAGRRSVALDAATLEAQDAVLIVTDHDGPDYAAVVASSRLVVDTRNATRDVRAYRERIVRA